MPLAAPPRTRKKARTSELGEDIADEEVKRHQAQKFQLNHAQDRIREWQAQGVTALPPDALSTISIPYSHRSALPSVDGPEIPADRSDLESINSGNGNVRGRETKRLADLEREEWIRKGRASTPRKRVVSDDHWRKARSAADSPKTSEKRAISTQVDQRSKKDERRAVADGKAEREERRRRRLEARKKAALEAEDLETEQIEHGRTGANDKGSTAPQDGEDINSNVGNHAGHGSDRDCLSETPYDWQSQPDRDTEDVHINTKYASTLGRTHKDTGTMGKRGVFNKTKEILGFSTSGFNMTDPLVTIEAWLGEQPDAITDFAEPVTVSQTNTGSKPRRERRRHSSRRGPLEPARLSDPNKIWDSISVGPRESVSHKVAPSAPIDGQASNRINEDGTPVTLRRRPARASRQRGVSRPRPIPTDETSADHATQPQVRAFTLPGSSRPGQDNAQTQHHAPPEPQSLSPPGIPAANQMAEQDPSFCKGVSSTSLKRKLTTHKDLMSQLSQRQSTTTSRRQHRDVTKKQESPEHAIKHILDTIQEDETKYNRELRTLVDGVIPVLLQSMLSKSDSAATAALFTSAEHLDGLNFTRPIIDMGVSLERLKSLHGRLATNNVDKLLSWCQTAHKAYSDYLAAWRLGFLDVIVNLAPLDDGQENDAEIMDQDNNGDIINATGEKVDVAYLLKRPLIRIRRLSKALCSLRDLLSDHVVVAKIADDYLQLTALARKKHQQEQGRLEDEAAACIDAKKARDIRTLSPLPGVAIAKDRMVRARDMFNLTLYHSTGQRMDSKIEIIIRESKPGEAAGSDVLICQVDEEGKWLLFEPVDLSNVSARRGESGFDLIIMVRGRANFGSEWYELLALTAEEPDAVADWMNMLGSKPLPPGLKLVSSSDNAGAEDSFTQHAQTTTLTSAALARVPSLESIDIPIGEPSILDGRPHAKIADVHKISVEKPLPTLNFGGGLQKRTLPQHWAHQSSVLPRKPVASSVPSSERTAVPQSTSRSVPFRHKHAVEGVSIPSRTQYQLQVPLLPTTSVVHEQKASHSTSNTVPQAGHVSEISTSTSDSSLRPEKLQDTGKRVKHVSLVLPEASTSTTRYSAGTVPTPSPTGDVLVSKARESPQRKPLSSTPLTESIREKWAAMSRRAKQSDVAPDLRDEAVAPLTNMTFDVPHPPKHKNRASMPILSNPILQEGERRASEQTRFHLPEQSQPIAVKDEAEERNEFVDSILPLPIPPWRHSHDTSTASDTADDDDESGYSDSSSDTSEDHGSEAKDDLRSLPDIMRKRTVFKQPLLQHSVPPTSGTRTLAPSDSASQGPYRSVPSSSTYPASKREWAVALVCSWSEAGIWEPIRDGECAILVSPGLLEAFPIACIHSQEGPLGDPIVAFELTPVVPLRKGTALDITIRSPPTAKSQIKVTNNVMFRSRTIIECDALYRLINWARCNNPTYLQLQRSRPQPQPAVTFSNQQSERPKSWFSFGGLQRRNSYRAGSIPPSVAESTMSRRTMSNALSALKRFSRSSGFSINRSSVIHRPGRATNQSLYSDSNTASGSGSSAPAPLTQIGFIPGKDGPNVPETSAEAVNGGGMVNNMKIKLFLRHGQDWKPLGGCRLSVLPATKNSTPEMSRPGSSAGGTPDASSSGPTRRSTSVGGEAQRGYRLPSSSHTPHRVHGDGREKRVLITQKDRADIVLLDEVLGESCFEKVAERGIAVKVWTEDNKMRNQGGVLTGRGRVYMMQFSGQSEASWVFGLCGTYRYSTQVNDY